LIFHLHFTAIVFTLLNLIVLFVRIKEENKALQI
jgi:isoprenylcysteine carboxyl methyltransferase (ICMT) family protein YpbQ